MLGRLGGAQEQVENVSEIGPSRLLVNRTEVVLVVFGKRGRGRVDRVHVDHRHGAEQNFGLRFDKLAVSPVPTCSVYEQPVHVHTA